MATPMTPPISRDILNQETNARFWAQTGYKPGQRLDPKNPLDKAKMPVWMDIFRKVSAEANAGSLVTTYDQPEVAQQLSDATVASTVAAAHVDAAAQAPDPTLAQQHAAAAATAQQVASQRLNEAAANQPPTVSPTLEQAAAREAARTPPPPTAPAADQIAHAQIQANGFLPPEQDPWDQRYVKPAPAAPSKSPRERPPSRDVLTKETNARFWIRTGYKPHQKLDMSIPEDRRQSRVWMEILREVEREANAGRLTLTNPELVPPPNGARPPQPRPPQPRPPAPRPPAPRPPVPPAPRPPAPQTRPPAPPPPRPSPQVPFPPQAPPGRFPPQAPPGMQPPGMQQPGAQQQVPPPWMPQLPQLPPWMPQLPPWMQQQPQPGGPAGQRPQPPFSQQPPQRPVTQPRPGPTPPVPFDAVPMPGPEPFADVPAATPGPEPFADVPAQTPADTAAQPSTEGAPAPGMSTTAKVALAVLGIAGLAGVTYAATRKSSPSRATARRGRSASDLSFDFDDRPSARGGRY